MWWDILDHSVVASADLLAFGAGVMALAASKRAAKKNRHKLLQFSGWA
jgi:hypothetical protein